MFAICVEASHQRGMGHLYRALALSSALRKQGARSSIYVNDTAAARTLLHDRALPHRFVALEDVSTNWEGELIQRDGIRVWINDRLNTRGEHAQNVLAAGARLATFDDRGPGAAFCALNVVTFPDKGEPLEGNAVITDLACLVLDPSIARYRRERRELRSVVVTMGGADTYGVTITVIRALKKRRRTAVVILGPAFAHDGELEQFGGEFAIKRNVPALAAELSRHDLAITAGGLTPCEANAAGLPCLIIATEPWEVRVGEKMASLGGCLYLGDRSCIDFSPLDRELDILAMSRAALAAIPVDGADRVARMLCEMP